MAESATGQDGWTTVLHQPSEEQQISKWEQLEGHWSGEGKHPTNWSGHPQVRVVDRELGQGSFGAVERVTYKAVTMARKHIEVKPWRGMTVEKLREESNAMERLVHRHILKLIGTYTFKRKHLYLMLYPAAVCDLNKFLKDIDDIRLDNVADQDDAFKRLRLLELKELGTIEELAQLRPPNQNETPTPRSATAVGFLQQTLGCMTEALAYVHQNDIRHGDLNPKNILLSPGRVYLADFGIARDVKESENSITSHRYGTPFWMAPEVHDEVDHHRSPADIWSLGCIFLKIMTVLYEETLDKYDQCMKEHDWKKKYEMLPKYLEKLRLKGLAAGFEHQEAPTFNSKHVIDLIENMLKYDPNDRPTAVEANTKLMEHGGLDQIYHLTCCHKPNTDVTEVINNKLKALHFRHASVLSENTRLKAEIEKMQERIRNLDKAENTYEQRINNERQHAAAQRNALQERYDQEVKLRKELEEKLKANEKSRRPRSQNRGRGGRAQGIVHSNWRANAASVHLNPIAPNWVPGSSFPRPSQPSHVEVAGGVGMQRRKSYLPVPSRPSTPIRPPCNRDPPSNSSTLVSSVHSTFSRASITTNESCSSVESLSQRSASPEISPTTMRPASSKTTDMKSPSPPSSARAKRAAEGDEQQTIQAVRPSYANIARSASNMNGT